MTQWEKIYNHLKGAGIEVYSPATKTGECTRPYVVVKEDGGSRYNTLSTRQDYYSVMCYVPGYMYSSLEGYVNKVKDILHALQPEIVCTNQITPSFYDDTVKAHMVSIMYSNFKKLNGIIR